MLKDIADFFRTLWRVSFKPQEVYRELDAVPVRQDQGLALLVVGTLIILVCFGILWELSLQWLQNYDRAVFPSTRARFGGYAFFFFLPGLIAQFITLAWIAYRIFPKWSQAWPALGLSLSPGFLVGGTSFLLWLLALGLKSIWIQPLVFLSLGAFNPVLFSLAFPAAYVFEHGELVANVKRYAEYEYDLNSWARRLAETEQELWYWIPALLIMAGLALWQGWLIYTAARELGDNQQSHPAGLVLLYTLAINSPLALVGVFSIIAIIVISY